MVKFGADRLIFAVIASPAGPYFAGGVKPINIWVTSEYSRAGVGGTGAAKCGGNYASSLIAQYQGYEHDCSQVMFIEPSEKDRLEELGGMNIMLITADGRLITPELTGTILEGVTRDSILDIAPELGLTPESRKVPPSELFARINSGEIVEAFACGTAAVITPVGSFRTGDATYTLQGGIERTLGIRNRILDIQYGRVPDTRGWMQRVI